MANSIHVTACDNELIIIAYQGTVSYEIGRILSGNNNQVDVTFSITNGPFMGSMTFSNVYTPIGAKVNTCLPAGNYSLLLLGVNWGLTTNFKVNVNGTDYNSSGISGLGLVYNPGPISITI